MSLIKKFLDKEENCNAITNEHSNETCDNEKFGSGTVDGKTIIYCSKHVPSKAAVGTGSGRLKPIKFLTEDEETITVE